jgi:hypothetical protein
MTTVTYDVAKATNAAPKRASLLVRILDRIAEARMQRALSEINRHRHLFDRSHRIGTPQPSELPFGR